MQNRKKNYNTTLNEREVFFVLRSFFFFVFVLGPKVKKAVYIRDVWYEPFAKIYKI